MKPSLQLKLGQQLTLTPQLRLAIRLLQLSALELEQELGQALESNPLLEREEDAVADFEASGDAAPVVEGAREDAEGADTESFDGEEPDFRWDDEPSRGNRQDFDGEEREDARAAPQDLHEHLLWQLRLSHLNPRDQQIGFALVEAIGLFALLVAFMVLFG